ncbi:MAG: hypothetical protein ACRD3C_22590 [Vicinamibacterales bacterium]
MPDTYDGTETTHKRRKGKEGMVCSGLNITPTANGGFAVDKNYRPADEKPRKGDSCCGPRWTEPEKFAFSSKRELKKFIDETFPD